jgi:hypothetical protein
MKTKACDKSKRDRFKFVGGKKAEKDYKEFCKYMNTRKTDL